MPFVAGGVYQPPSGAENAAPGQVIRSATWNSIFTDISTLGLTVLGKTLWVTNPPRTVLSGSFTVLASDNAVFVKGNSPTITTPPATAIQSPFMIIGDAASVFQANNAVVVPTGGDTFSGYGSITLTRNYQVMVFYPLAGGGYVVAGSNAILPLRSTLAPFTPALGVSSTTTRFMIGSQYTVIPQTSGNLVIYSQETGMNNSLGAGFSTRILYGTGSAPTLGQVETGNIVSQAQNGNVAVANGALPIAQQAYVSGLVVGTPYWIDVSLRAQVGGTATLNNVTFIVIES